MARNYRVNVWVDSQYSEELSITFIMPADSNEKIAQDEITQYIFSRITVDIEPVDLKTAIELEKGGE